MYMNSVTALAILTYCSSVAGLLWTNRDFNLADRDYKELLELAAHDFDYSHFDSRGHGHGRDAYGGDFWDDDLEILLRTRAPPPKSAAKLVGKKAEPPKKVEPGKKTKPAKTVEGKKVEPTKKPEDKKAANAKAKPAEKKPSNLKTTPKATAARPVGPLPADSKAADTKTKLADKTTPASSKAGAKAPANAKAQLSASTKVEPKKASDTKTPPVAGVRRAPPGAKSTNPETKSATTPITKAGTPGPRAAAAAPDAKSVTGTKHVAASKAGTTGTKPITVNVKAAFNASHGTKAGTTPVANAKAAIPGLADAKASLRKAQNECDLARNPISLATASFLVRPIGKNKGGQQIPAAAAAAGERVPLSTSQKTPLSKAVSRQQLSTANQKTPFSTPAGSNKISVGQNAPLAKSGQQNPIAGQIVPLRATTGNKLATTSNQKTTLGQSTGAQRPVTPSQKASLAADRSTLLTQSTGSQKATTVYQKTQLGATTGANKPPTGQKSVLTQSAGVQKPVFSGLKAPLRAVDQQKLGAAVQRASFGAATGNKLALSQNTLLKQAIVPGQRTPLTKVAISVALSRPNKLVVANKQALPRKQTLRIKQSSNQQSSPGKPAPLGQQTHSSQQSSSKKSSSSNSLYRISTSPPDKTKVTTGRQVTLSKTASGQAASLRTTAFGKKLAAAQKGQIGKTAGASMIAIGQTAPLTKASSSSSLARKPKSNLQTKPATVGNAAPKRATGDSTYPKVQWSVTGNVFNGLTSTVGKKKTSAGITPGATGIVAVNSNVSRAQRSDVNNVLDKAKAITTQKKAVEKAAAQDITQKSSSPPMSLAKTSILRSSRNYGAMEAPARLGSTKKIGFIETTSASGEYASKTDRLGAERKSSILRIPDFSTQSGAEQVEADTRKAKKKSEKSGFTKAEHVYQTDEVQPGSTNGHVNNNSSTLSPEETDVTASIIVKSASKGQKPHKKGKTNTVTPIVEYVESVENAGTHNDAEFLPFHKVTISKPKQKHHKIHGKKIGANTAAYPDEIATETSFSDDAQVSSHHKLTTPESAIQAPKQSHRKHRKTIGRNAGARIIALLREAVAEALASDELEAPSSPVPSSSSSRRKHHKTLGEKTEAKVRAAAETETVPEATMATMATLAASSETRSGASVVGSASSSPRRGRYDSRRGGRRRRRYGRLGERCDSCRAAVQAAPTHKDTQLQAEMQQPTGAPQYGETVSQEEVQSKGEAQQYDEAMPQVAAPPQHQDDADEDDDNVENTTDSQQFTSNAPLAAREAFDLGAFLRGGYFRREPKKDDKKEEDDDKDE